MGSNPTKSKRLAVADARKQPEIVEVPESAYQQLEPDVIVVERGLATLYLEENPGDDLNRQAIYRFARWLVEKGFVR